MAFFGLAMILLIVYGIEFLAYRMQKKNDKTIEEIHSRAYEWVDDHTDDPLLAVKRKAEIDEMVHDTVRSKGREYHPPVLKEMTAKDFVSAVPEMTDNEMTDDDLWYYKEHTKEEKREHLVQCYMRQFGDSREEAEAAADRFFKAVREIEKYSSKNNIQEQS